MASSDNSFRLEGTATLHTSVMRRIGQIASQLFTRPAGIGWEYGFFIAADGVRYFGLRASDSFWAPSGSMEMADREQSLELSYEPLAVFNAIILHVLSSDLIPEIAVHGSIPEVPECGEEIAELSGAILAEYARQLRTEASNAGSASAAIDRPERLDFRA